MTKSSECKCGEGEQSVRWDMETVRSDMQSACCDESKLVDEQPVDEFQFVDQLVDETQPVDEQLASWRLEIDKIDARLIVLLAERFAITKRIGDYKAERNLHTRDFQREERQLNQIKELAAEHDISESFSEDLLRLVVDEAVRRASRRRASRNWRN